MLLFVACKSAPDRCHVLEVLAKRKLTLALCFTSKLKRETNCDSSLEINFIPLKASYQISDLIHLYLYRAETSRPSDCFNRTALEMTQLSQYVKQLLL